MRSSSRCVRFAFALALVTLAAQPKPFKVVEAGIHQTEDGPLSPPGTIVVPGEVIFFSCRLDGYTVSPEKKVSIQYEFSAVDPNGIPIVEPISGKVDAELSPQDKEWKPKIRHTALIPPLAESGIYKVRISVKDELSGAVASSESPFTVRGHAVERSETLVVRNFRFLRTEEDKDPLKIAAYRPGDVVWARFDITGYKMGKGNQRDVAYTITVTRADGKVLVSPGEPSVDKGESFYPMRYAPCIINLNLEPTIRPDEFTILVTAQDRIGTQTGESRHAFRVE